ncbi:MAG: glycosyltransferase [Prolixibacteraceae bacterium]|jgi:cellulose synthase/poly-beta-1,6-N-acetylglucosamine synthase-like glycosyltransferase|nr:glycosyltransferase [Prolixibacteraceae bacterium]
MIVLQIIFWVSVAAIAYSYVLYPLILQLILRLKGKALFSQKSDMDYTPKLSVLIAAYNESSIIEKKIKSLYNTGYPIEKIEVLIGSDNSTDGTNEILQKLSTKYTNLYSFIFNSRQGKINIINQLEQKATGEILILTDANVLLQHNTLPELVKHFSDDRIGLIDTQMKNYGMNNNGISFQEKSYISREVYIKSLESKTFGTMTGPFGGCYAIRRELYTPVPANYLVDDFFICMNVLRKGKMAINNIEALAFEDVSNNLAIEFKRKIRIGTGNFQNLWHFSDIWLKLLKPAGFCFFSHKVLRWFGPFFLVAAFISNLLLFETALLYQISFVLQVIVTFSTIADIILKKIGNHIVLLRFITHFYAMNLSLLIGFFKSLKGVKSNVWKPTKRLQK